MSNTDSQPSSKPGLGQKKNLFYRSISWTMHLLHAHSSAHSFPVRLSLQVPYRKTQDHHQFIKATYHPKWKKESSLGMLKAHQIICGFFHPKLSRLRHQYSGTEHISFRTSCNFSYIFGDFRNDGTVYLFHHVSPTKLPCSTEQNGLCSPMNDCKWVLWSKGNIKTQHKGKRKKK